MTNNDQNMSADELEALSGEPLPDREAMSVLPVDPTGGPLPLPLPVEEAEQLGGGATMPVEPTPSE